MVCQECLEQDESLGGWENFLNSSDGSVPLQERRRTAKAAQKDLRVVRRNCSARPRKCRVEELLQEADRQLQITAQL